MREHNDPRHEPNDDPAEQSASGSADLSADTPEHAVPTAPAPDEVHRWLDGEGATPRPSNPDAAKHVKFWAKVNAETERRRRMQTPRGLDAIIMEKLEPPVVKDE